MYGPGGRVSVYTSIQKKKDSIKSSDPPLFKNKIDFRKTQMNQLKNWNHFDSNMNNNLVEQRKIIYSKNYEIDSRASGLKDFGVQPLMGDFLKNKRSIDKMLFEQTRGKSLEDRVPAYKKNYTPITQYFKSVMDARVTKEGGGKISSLRSNLNYS